MAAAIMIMAVVLGVRAGQRQLEIQKRQQVGIHLQRAIDYRSEGDLEAALAEYQRVLLLEPGNVAAVEGIENLFSMASGDAAPAGGNGIAAAPAATSGGDTAQAPPAPAGPQTAANEPQAQVAAMAQSSPLAAPSPTTDTLTSLWRTAQAAYTAGDWVSATDLLLNVRDMDPEFQKTQVTDLLYTSYVNLAAEKDQAGQLEEALAFVDKALALRPDPALRSARSKAEAYMAVLNTYSLGWETVIEGLQSLYEEDPSYRDVEERLLEAHTAFGDKLMRDGDACAALDAYVAAIDINVQPVLFEKRDNARAECDGVPSSTVILLTPEATRQATVARPNTVATPAAASATSTGAAVTTGETATGETAGAEAETAVAAGPAPVVGAPPAGRVLYSAASVNDGRARIFSQSLAGGAPQILVEDGTQPALRSDGKRLVYYNTRSDMAGLSALDPESGLLLRFTSYAEDRRPSWNPEGNRLVFASNREGDRRWRIYVGWAEVDGEVATLGFGDAAAWSPAGDRIAVKGCDETGNGCGLWTMTSSGAGRSPLTTVPEDTNPAWSPNGR
ncbi:MAG: PD40 domain-containing protein, partial [Caldilineaceae bacterium]|nr:PD40 domain-containing protein [Caldilineaceae bacterium]